MQTASKEELYKPYLSLFGGKRTVCLDNRFCVVGPDDMFLPGERLLDSVRETVPEPLGVAMETTLYKNDRFYCCLIHLIKNDIGESIAYICELIGSESARRISESTEEPSDILPLYNAVEMNVASVWQHAASLRASMTESRDYSRLSDVLAIETAMSNIAAVCGNAFHYAEMLYSSQRETMIDAGALCENLAKRCNAGLAKCGRRIEARTEPGQLCIYADSRRAVVALVNAVQNALLYSPRESEPVLTACLREKHGRRFVEIRVVNESSMFSSRDFSGDTEVNFSYQRLGYGIPIIKRFAQASGGSFDMTEENGRVTVTISLPAAYNERGEIPLRSPEVSEYRTGIPDYTDIMMREVELFFGEAPEGG